MAIPTTPATRSKGSTRVSPVIKGDGLRVSGGEKVDLKPYTLGDRREVSLHVLEALRKKHETLFALLGPSLALYLGADAEIRLEELTAMKYYHIAKDINSDFHFCVFRAEHATGSGFLGLAPQVALTAVNLLLGGKGDPPRQARPLTKIESDLSVDVVNQFLSGWKAIFKKTMEFDPQAMPEEAAQVNSLCDPHTGIFFAKLKFRIKECEGEACLGFPVHMIESVVQHLEQSQGSPKEKRQSLTPQWSPIYGGVPVSPEIRIPGGQMTAGEFLTLTPGTIIPLPEQAMERACMRLNGRILFQGSFGMSADRLALSLQHKLQV